jgi:hypothetical protein
MTEFHGKERRQTEAGEISPREIRIDEGADERQSVSGGEARVAGDSQGVWSQHERIFGAIGEGDAPTVLPGGMVSRLISDAERRLGRAEEALHWYSREKEIAIEELKQLRAMAIAFGELQSLGQNQDIASDDQPPQ